MCVRRTSGRKASFPGSRWIPRGFLELRIEDQVPERSSEVILYCAGGTRSALAARALEELGYTNVKSMAGGFTAWKRAGYPYDKPFIMTPEQNLRYARHTMLPEIGEAGQVKLLKSRVLCLGAGALGSSAGIYLGAAGVGTLGFIDDDVVDASNLQRQILHTTDRIGTPKVESARKAINAINPDVKVIAHATRLSSENVLDILKDYDVIIDGADNFPSRYLLNDAALKLGKPVIHASIYRFEGQVTAFIPNQGPCYRCLYPSPPPADMAPSCQEAGVLGVLPGRGRRAAGDRGHQVHRGHRQVAGRPPADVRRLEHQVPRDEAASRSGLPHLRRRREARVDRADRLPAVLQRHDLSDAWHRSRWRARPGLSGSARRVSSKSRLPGCQRASVRGNVPSARLSSIATKETGRKYRP